MNVAHAVVASRCAYCAYIRNRRYLTFPFRSNEEMSKKSSGLSVLCAVIHVRHRSKIIFNFIGIFTQTKHTISILTVIRALFLVYIIFG